MRDVSPGLKRIEISIDFQKLMAYEGINLSEVGLWFPPVYPI
jgi:hypothetical protein